MVRAGDVQGCAAEPASTAAAGPGPLLEEAMGGGNVLAAARRRMLGMEPGGEAAGLDSGECGTCHGAACDAVAMYWKGTGALTHVVLRASGHMPPHDAPRAAQYMIERWLAEAVGGK